MILLLTAASISTPFAVYLSAQATIKFEEALRWAKTGRLY